MPLSLPNLDDRTFTDLSAEMRSLIPQYSKSWSSHNPSDPGIILLELMAWLTEMILYRLNQINERSYLSFIEMIGVEPSGPQAEINFKIEVANKDDLPEDFVIERGTRVATKNESPDEQIIFETLVTITKDDGWWDNRLNHWVFQVMAVNTLEIRDDLLGKSDGSPKQEFSFNHRPIFLNKEGEYYKGNPQIYVGGERWNYKNTLFESGAADKHFTVDHLAGLVRFGDGQPEKDPLQGKGKVPPPGAEILCTYRKLGGVKGNVGAGEITRLIESDDDYNVEEHIIGTDSSKVTVTNEYPASGGVDSEGLEDLLKRALERIQERYRAVSDADFEELVKQAAPGRVSRIKVLPDQNLENTTASGEGHVSLIILPACSYLGLKSAVIDPFSNEFSLAHSCTRMKDALTQHNVEILKQNILRLLDDRRLITTVLHVVSPTFNRMSLEITVSPKPGVDLGDLTEKIKVKMASYLDPYVGWEDGKGWPFGRNVYRSELYQQLEGMEGVDHVKSMLINGMPGNAFITVGENDLVCLNNINVTMEPA